MKTLLLFSLLFLSEFAFTQNASLLLETAYKEKSGKKLTDFFDIWQKETSVVSENELSKQNDTLKQAYKVFTAFYNPSEIGKLGGSEWGNDIYKAVSYLIAQDKIKIYFKDKIFYTEQEIDDYVVTEIKRAIKNDSTRQHFLERKDDKLSKIVLENFSPMNGFSDDIDERLVDSIKDFRPNLTCKNKVVLYLTPKYDTILNAFLGNTFLPLGSGSIMTPARATIESEKRKIFLEKKIKIWYGHWGGYWQLLSYPQVYSIAFDREMKYAKVNFRMVYEGGEAILKNSNTKWIILSAKRTWIE